MCNLIPERGRPSSHVIFRSVECDPRRQLSATVLRGCFGYHPTTRRSRKGPEALSKAPSWTRFAAFSCSDPSGCSAGTRTEMEHEPNGVLEDFEAADYLTEHATEPGMAAGDVAP